MSFSQDLKTELEGMKKILNHMTKQVILMLPKDYSVFFITGDREKGDQILCSRFRSPYQSN